jgi:hypothetical protein
MEVQMSVTPTSPEAAEAAGEDRDKPIKIIVNGRQFEVTDEDISYEEVVNLRYNNDPPKGENVVITVTYSKGHSKDGSLLPGKSVRVKAGMIFNVIDTDKS